MIIGKKRNKSILNNFEKKLEKSKEILPSICRMGEIIFTSMSVIVVKLYSNHPKNLNHVHKESKYLVSVITNLGGNISGGDTVFYDWVKTSKLGIRSHTLKHLHGRMISGPFKKNHEVNLWRGHRAVISFILAKHLPTFLLLWVSVLYWIYR